MSFFDKMKQGASEAAKKAQQTVETTKLRVQISSKEKEQEKSCKLIGEAVYQAYEAGNWKQAEKEIVAYCEHIRLLRQDIQSIDLKIKQAKHVKECRCGKMVASNVKFCPACGFAFPDVPQEEAAAAEVFLLCQVCRTPNEADTKFCSHCGIVM
ncbi:zinc ribbon domain-containing protein [Paenibacillus agricola]|uniref:Zinc ribbon domain-containing protein n=1 Tax=Paenibacillus agricola TaxID=2716264 RepID=A0ABX0J1Y0_9BACL|nr:zinc ribbon domain-containing protein [Paenibacillus agricola]NHN30290.1 zinc ribbon domain-containing protein [Paenibacillus agricola]